MYRRIADPMDSDELKEKIGIKDDGTYRVNPDTGVVEKHGWFGWSETDTKIEAESGNVENRGWFGWNRTDTRIDPDSGVVQQETWFGHADTDKRIDPDTGSIQDRGWFGWNDTDERIDPETGNHQKQGWFGWDDSGASPTTPKNAEDKEDQSNINQSYSVRGASANVGSHPSKSKGSGKSALILVFGVSIFIALHMALQGLDGSSRPSENIVRQLFRTIASSNPRVRKVVYYKSFVASGGQYEMGIPAGTKVFPVMVCFNTEQYPLGLDPFNRNIDLDLQRAFRDFLLVLPTPDDIKPACEPDNSSWRWLYVDSSSRWNIVSDPRGGV
jgi:hypothetical protein